MTLAVPKDHIDDFAALLAAAGIVEIEASYRGPKVVYAPDAGEDAIQALKLLRERLELIDNRDGRRQFMECLSENLKKKSRPPKENEHRVH